MRFGSDPYGGRDYKGSMDDVAVYAYALPPDEIENIRKAGVDGIYTPAKVYRWKGANGADWSVAGNWNNTVPGASDTAVLSDSSSAGATVNLDTDVTVGGLTFNNKVANQTIASTSGKTLALSGGGVEVQAGTLSIACPIDATANGLIEEWLWSAEHRRPDAGDIPTPQCVDLPPGKRNHLERHWVVDHCQ